MASPVSRPSTAPLFYAIGLALAHTLKATTPSPRVLLGMDTRESSDWIAAILTAGLTAGGASVESAGVITTPAIAFLTHTHRFATGIVISASHNPWQDNGIKLFGPDGFKLPDATELAIEDEIFRQLEAAAATLRHNDRKRLRSTKPTAPNTSASCSPPSPASRSTASASSSTAPTEPPLPSLPSSSPDLGGEVVITHASPDGCNINEICGALHPDVVAAEVVNCKKPPWASPSMATPTAPSSPTRTAAWSTAMPSFCSPHATSSPRPAHQRHRRRDHHVQHGPRSRAQAQRHRDAPRRRRRQVRARADALHRRRARRRTVRPHHLHRPQHHRRRPAHRAAVLDIVHRSGKSLAELVADLKVFPQVIVNVKVREKKPLEAIPTVAAAIRAAEAGTGRFRPSRHPLQRHRSSGRVMIEAESEPLMRHHADTIAAAIRTEIGI